MIYRGIPFANVSDQTKGLIFIPNRQRRKEGTLCCFGAGELTPPALEGGDRTHAAPPGEAGYARLSQLG
jgi:hypothetical protein